MAKEHLNVFTSIFEGVPESFGDEEDFMWEVIEVVPNSHCFHKIINRNQPEKKLVLNLREKAKQWEKEGLNIYMLSDNPDIVHALAIHKSYLPFVKFLQRNSDNDVESIDRVFAADIGSDYI